MGSAGPEAAQYDWAMASEPPSGQGGGAWGAQTSASGGGRPSDVSALKARADATRTGAWLLLGANAALVLHSAWALALIRRLQEGVDGSAVAESAARLDQIGVILGVASIAIFAFAGLAYFFWLNRASQHAHEIAPSQMTITPNWAVGWHFVPIASLWMPFRAILQVWDAVRGPGGERRPLAFTLWWFGFVSANLISSIAFRRELQTPEPTLEDLSSFTMFDIVAGGVAMVSNIAFLSVLGSITGALVYRAEGEAAVRRGD